MRAQLLFRGPGVSVARYDHVPAVPHRDPDREESHDHVASFVERGTFRVHCGGEDWLLTPGALFVTRPGLRYRCTHESATPDDVCLALRVPADLVEEVESATGGRWDRLVPVAPLTNRLAYLHRRLGATIRDDAAPMAVPAVASEVVAALVAPRPAPAARLHRAGQIDWYTRRIDAARDLMEHRYAEPLTIETLSREVGISPFHFCRVFRELQGMPPHRYLVRLRLRRAAEMLRRGESVTGACFASGFQSLSHFVSAFRRAYGVTPGRQRGAPSAGRSRRRGDH